MYEIENRGKSLIFLKLCEEWNLDFKINRNESYGNPIYYITNKNKPENVISLNLDYNITDVYGFLIDHMITLKHTEGNTFFT